MCGVSLIVCYSLKREKIWNIDYCSPLISTLTDVLIDAKKAVEIIIQLLLLYTILLKN